MGNLSDGNNVLLIEFGKKKYLFWFGFMHMTTSYCQLI